MPDKSPPTKSRFPFIVNCLNVVFNAPNIRPFFHSTKFFVNFF